MRQPHYITSLALHNLIDCQGEIAPGVWVPVRPVAYNYRLFNRFKLAWLVFIGKADALVWVGYENDH